MSESPYLADTHQALSDATDAFGHRDYADAIVHALVNAEPPFTVGLFGDWGVGKSTVLHEAGRRLEAQGTLFVQFDAWRYEGEAFRRQFLKDVGAQLVQMKVLDDTFDPAQGLQDLYQSVQTQGREKWRLDRAALLKLCLFFVLLVALGVILGTTPGELFDAESYRTTTAAALFLAFIGLVGAVMTRVDNTLEITRDVITKHRLEEPERFTEQFARMLGAVRAKRLVIAIDNLDRLNAEDAVLFLNTVKTYLEPVIASSKADATVPAVVVLIAADDRALRRHLLSRSSDASESADRQRYADEYLRKFFNASLYMRPVLADDMREYMRQHLTGYAERWAKPGELDELVRIASAGLRHNPRRVKQWVNNLELRTRLIRAREKASDGHVARLDPPITDEILMVAKLALIEEEWPEAFANLQRAPLLLNEWQAAADAASTSGRPQSWGRDEEGWPECAAFLRATSHISVGSVRPFLRLRRSVAERDLPKYDQVHEALTSGQTAQAEEVFGELDQAASAAYSARLEQILEEELNAGNVDGARSVVLVAISAGQLRESSGTLAVLKRAAAEPDVRDGLPHMPMGALEAALRRLGRYEVASKVIWDRLFVDLADSEGFSDHRIEMALVLARALSDHQLSESGERSLEQWTLTVEDATYESRETFVTMVAPILMARPDWVTVTGFGRALEVVEASRAFDSQAWDIVILTIRQGRGGQAAVERAGEQILSTLASLGEEDNASLLIAPATDYLDALAGGGYDADAFAASLAGYLGRLWGRESGERVPPNPSDHEWAQLGFKLFESAGAHDGDVARTVIEHLVSEPAAVAYAVNAGAVSIDGLTDGQRSLFSDQLASELLPAVQAYAADASEILEAITRLAPDRASAHVAEAITSSIVNGYAETIDAIWETQRDRVISEAETLVRTFADRLQVGTDAETATSLLSILPNLVPHVSEETRTYLASVMWPIFDSQPRHVTRETAEQAMLAIADADKTSAAVDQWVAYASADLSAVDERADRAAAILVRLDAYLDGERRAQLADRLTTWVRDESTSLTRVAGVAAGLSGLRVEAASPLVAALKDRDAGLPRDDVDARVPVVQAILHLGRSSRSQKLRDEVAAYEERLAKGFSEDEAVIKRVRELRQQAGG